MAQIAREAGVSEQDASRGLSQLMPEIIDRVTPDGQMPDENNLVASVDALVGGPLRRRSFSRFPTRRLFWVAPLAGAALAGVTYRALLEGETVEPPVTGRRR